MPVVLGTFLMPAVVGLFVMPAMIGTFVMPAMVGTFLVPAVAGKIPIPAVLSEPLDSYCQTGAGNRPVSTRCCTCLISFELQTWHITPSTCRRLMCKACSET